MAAPTPTKTVGKFDFAKVVRMIMRSKNEPDRTIVDSINYEAYKVHISQIGLQYFANFAVYERYRAVVSSFGVSPNLKKGKSRHTYDEE